MKRTVIVFKDGREVGREEVSIDIQARLRALDKILPRPLEDALEGKQLFGKYAEAKRRKEELREEIRKNLT